MSNPGDNRLLSNLSKLNKGPPGGDSQNHNGIFPTGQGGRTVLPPITSAFPTSQSSVSTPNYLPYSQQRSSPGKIDHPSYGQWSPAAVQVQQQQHSGYYEHYDRYPQAQSYQSYHRNSPPIPADPPISRKLPPLVPEKYQGNYGAVAPHVSSYDVRSSAAAYPNEYYPNQQSYSYPPVPPDLRHHSSPQSSMHHHTQSMGIYSISERGMPAQVEAHGPSPYARGPITNTRIAEEPLTMLPSEEPAIKKKRKRADAAQLKVLNETYERTAFPSTEERAELARKLDMSARSVQIWFQNKRQSMRQTTRQSSTTTNSSFSMAPHTEDHQSFAGSISPTTIPSAAYTSRSSRDSRAVTQDSRSSIAPHQREEDPRKWSQSGRY